MPRHGQLTDVEKARSVFAHVGRPATNVEALDESELRQCAAIYDECIAPGSQVSVRFGEFWDARQQRLAAAKATDETTDDTTTE